MTFHFKSRDCPDADGCQPLFGEKKWTLSFPLEGGADHLKLEIGSEGREAFKAMLAQEEADDAKELTRGKYAWRSTDSR